MSEWLFIDTHAPGCSRLGWLSQEKKPQVRTYKSRPPMLIRQLFEAGRERLKGCAGICVVAGPGSFSAIRIGVLYANLLARLFKLPLFSISAEDAEDLSQLSKKLTTLSSTEYVAPIYDREPNITLPRV